MGPSEDQSDNQTGPVVEIELTVQNPAYPFVGVSEEEQCRVELAKIIPRPEGKYAEFFNVLGAPPARITSHVDTYDTVETSLLSEYDDGGLFEFIVSGNCPAYRLAELGALPKTVEGVDGRGRIVAEIPPRNDPPAVTGQFLEEYSDFELIAKRTKDTHTSMLTPSTLQQSILNDLTNRQQEVLQTAFGMGYYEWPRDCTGQDVADELGITSATFSEHVFAAERKILAFLFGNAAKTHLTRET
ncbi:helix-turn-helix domain-containing protein [Halorubrum lacusprofundi]|jgi:predicted DNA binding protein|uniref:Bacterio-opsin activator HTH domain protein n=1 Tax=Halorubrum lacusprofundi (strain ATCC 49239 / DSM 5036 / JCM 8891 / ACAM 34) TaxID=416348 RepID=B9LMP4_HALLT|nr:helix-turn-helix domain-containing protein [Halorubrum lacusprofundi]ACM56632.1 Bacterio-opsin activator HTH domain protein [Halorubrum lacusprofundi ATCC 49239]MCG1005103.1 helix-turn-helix domain-containing protein [Halorubrum lacusprofundi]